MAFKIQFICTIMHMFTIIHYLLIVCTIYYILEVLVAVHAWSVLVEHNHNHLYCWQERP